MVLESIRLIAVYQNDFNRKTKREIETKNALICVTQQ